MASAYFRQMMAVLAAGPGDPYMLASARTLFATNRAITVSGNKYEAVKIKMPQSPYALVSPRLCFPGFYVKTGASGNETALGNDIVFEGIQIRVGGTAYPLRSGGSLTPTVTNGSYIWTDEDNTITIPANTDWYVEFADLVNVAGTDYRPTVYLAQSGDGANSSTTTQSGRLASGSYTQPGRLTTLYGPCCIVAKGWVAAGRPAVPLVVGDSIGFGMNDYNIGYATDGVFGHIGRGLLSATGGRMQHANFCAPGTRFSNFSASAGEWALRKQILQDFNWPFTSIISEMGINTVANFDAATTAAHAATGWAFLKTLGSKRVVQTTMTPQVTIGNNYAATIADQGLASDASHVALDDLIMTVPTNVDAVIDVRPYFSDQANGNPRKWKVSSYVGSLGADVSIGGASFTVDVAPEVDDFLVIDAGTANAELKKCYGVTGSGPYTVTFNGTLTKAHTTGAVIRVHYTEDGTHPTTKGALLGVPAIEAAKVAGVIV